MQCPECRTNNLPRARFCTECGTSLARNDRREADLLAERHQVTVLFCDLAYSARLVRMLGEHFDEVNRALQSVSSSVVRTYGGYVAQSLGDGLLVYFGFPEPCEDDARRAVSAGLELIDAVRQFDGIVQGQHNVSFAARVGIDTGLASSRDGTESEAFANGETRTLVSGMAARLAGAAEPGTLLISERTCRLVESYFAIRDLGSLDFKRLGILNVYGVQSGSTVGARSDVLGSGNLTPLANRREESELQPEASPSAATESPWLAQLESLHVLLRAHGFSPTPDRWLNAADLLIHLLRERALPTDGKVISRYLAPLFARNAREQELFEGLFLPWWREYQPEAAPAAIPTLANVAPGAPWLKWITGWRAWALVLVVLAAVAGSLFLILADNAYRQAATATAKRQEQAQMLTQQASATREQGRRVAIKPLAPRRPVEVPPPMPSLSIDEPQFDLWTKAWLHLLDLMAFLLPPLLIALFIVRSLFGKRVLKQSRGNFSDPLHDLPARLLQDDLFDGPRVRNALRRLHVPVEQPTRQLDIERTVGATVRRAGLFSPVQAAKGHVPEVVLWINSRGRQDPALSLASLLARRLSGCDLTVTSYSYRGHPEQLLDLKTNEWYPREHVLSRHAGCRLLVIGNAAGLVDAWSAQPLPWVAETAVRSSMLILEPSPQRHDYAKPLLAAGVLLAPLTTEGIETLSARATGLCSVPPAAWPRSLPPRFRDAEKLRSPVPLQRAAARDLLLELDAYLGRRGMELLTAASAYPELRWDLVRVLDVSLFPHDSEEREARLLQLAQLPWMRDGWMPNWLRLLLLRRLPIEDLTRIRGVYDGLLHDGARQPGSGAFQLWVRIREISEAWQAELRQYVRWLFLWAERKSTINDAVFVELMLGRWFSRLDFELPRLLEKWLPAARLDRRSGLWVCLLLALVLAGGSGVTWHATGGAWLTQQLAQNVSVDVPVTLVYRAETAPLAEQLRQTLASQFKVQTKLASEALYKQALAKGPEQAAVLIYRSGWSAPARWLADRVTYATYGAPVVLLAADASGATGLMSVDARLQLYLLAPSIKGHVFVDALRYPFARAEWERRMRQNAATPTAGVVLQTFPTAAAAATPAPLPQPQVSAVVPPAIALSSFRDQLDSGGQGPEMIVIPPGTFIMGSVSEERGRTPDEGPQRPVTIQSFAISRTEVTFEDYDRFAKATGRTLPSDSGWGRGTRPVINVSWSDAVAFTEWLSKESQQRYRLPTEAEWEYAARAETKTPFSTGDCISVKQANFADRRDRSYDSCPSTGEYVGETKPVGTYDPNAFGLYDMHGNVWEWVQDCWHGSYKVFSGEAPKDGQAWLERDFGLCGLRVMRGGSWDSARRELRAANRDRATTVEALNQIGFRIAKTF